MHQLRPAQCIVLVTALLSLELTLWDPENEATPILLINYSPTLQRRIHIS